MYKNADAQSSNVWLNAFAIRYYYLAENDDYETIIKIDQNLLKNVLEFLLKNQLPSGFFQEEDFNPLLFKIFPNSDYKSDALFMNFSTDKMILLNSDELNRSTREHRIDKLNPHLITNKYLKNFKNLIAYRLTPISLTSHVLITLNLIESNNNKLRQKIEKSKKMAINFLINNLSELDSSFEIAITTYALLTSKSSTLDVYVQLGVDLLKQQAKIIKNEMIYWSRVELDDINSKRDFYSTFVKHQSMQRFDRYYSESVEASGYSLLICIKLNLDYCDMIVNYLNYVRNSFNGFITPFDTIIALHSLIEYSLNSDYRSKTDIQIKFNFNEFSSNFTKAHEVNIRKDSLSKKNCFVSNNAYSGIFLQAKGNGFGLIQIKREFHVNKEQFLIQPSIKAFELDVKYVIFCSLLQFYNTLQV